MIDDWDWGNHLGTPVWGVLAACAVLGFYGHQLGDLAGEDGFGEGGKVGIRFLSVLEEGSFWTYCCNARRSSRSLPTS